MGTLDAEVFDRVGGRSQAGGISELNRPAFESGLESNHVSRGPRRAIHNARGKPQSALNRLLLPTLGRPAIATFHPEISRRPTAPTLDRALPDRPGAGGFMRDQRGQPGNLGVQGAMHLVKEDLGRVAQ